MNELNKGLEEKSIITVDEIHAILKNYRIGKKPLSKLLGWGETTIIRYIEGDVPTNEYSDKLKAIMNNPSYYYDILMKNKDSLTGVAFRKSKQAVLDLLLESKIDVVAQYMINMTDGEISASYIQRLLYYVQSFSLALYDKEMFEEECVINSGVLPYQQVYDSIRTRGISCLDIHDEILSEEEKQLIKNVVDSFLWYGIKALNAMTEDERDELRISRDKNNNKIIAKDILKSYFKEITERYDIQSVLDIHRYPDAKILVVRNLV